MKENLSFLSNPTGKWNSEIPRAMSKERDATAEDDDIFLKYNNKIDLIKI